MKLFPSDPVEQQAFGISVAVHEDTMVVGAYADKETDYHGAAYVFERREGEWVQTAKLHAPKSETGGWFGVSVDVWGDYIAVGAPDDDEYCPDDIDCDSGAVFLFKKIGGTWTRTNKITSSGFSPGDQFGTKVRIVGGTLVASAPKEDLGKAYVFEKSREAWPETGRLFASNHEGMHFGWSVDLEGSSIIVGDPSGQNGGAAYVFEKIAGVWTQSAMLVASDAQRGQYLGGSVAISGDIAIAGAPSDAEHGELAGAAYVFSRETGTWLQQGKLTPSDPDPLDRFGSRVVLRDDIAVITALSDGWTGDYNGSAYLYHVSGSVLSEVAKFGAFGPDTGDSFGWALGVSEDTVAVGGYDFTYGSNAGAVYVFLRNSVLAGNVDTGHSGLPVNVLALEGSVGGECRKLPLRSGTPSSLFVGRAPQGSGQYAVWIYDGGIQAGANLRIAKNNVVHELGTGVRCLPVNNSVTSGLCPCPITFPIGVTSRSLGNRSAERYCLNRSPGHPKAPTFVSLTFPPGEFLIGGLVHDRNSINSPAGNVSIANWLRVQAAP